MEEPISKTQKKREAEALQKLGIKITELSLEKIEALPLTPALKDAILMAKTIKSHGAMRRHAQLIGKLMRAADHEAISGAYEQMTADDKAQTAQFHEVEAWRERLINDDRAALTEFIDAYQPEDIQQLRQLVKKAIDEKRREKNTGASKALFRYIRGYIL